MNVIRWSLATVCLSLLTACGGGGDDKNKQGGKKPDPEPTVQSAGYSVALSDGTSDISSYQLDIVDPSSARLLRSVPVDRDDAWLTTVSRSQSSDGRTQTQQHEVALYYVDGRRVKAVDLTRGSSTQPRQVSSLTDACRILWHIDTNLGAKDSWLAIVRAGTDGDCETGADDAFALVHSSTAATDTANAGPFSLADLITSGRDAAGQLNRLITFERSEGRFVQWLPANGLARSDVTNGGAIPSNADVRWLGSLPGFQDRGIVQINGMLRVLSWNDAGATLSPSLAAGLVPFGPFVTTDASRLYVVATHLTQVIMAFDGTGAVSQIATLDAAKGEATELLASADMLWIVQKDTTLTSAPTTLTAISKTTGAARVVDRYEVPSGLPEDIGLMLLGVNGNRLVYAKPSDPQDDDPVGLHIVDHGAASPRPLAQHVQGIGTQLDPTALVGQARATTQLLWCDIGTPEAPVDCNATRFKGYNLATNAVTSLGPQQVDADASTAIDSAFIENPHGLSSLISTTREDYRGSDPVPVISTRLWQFKPDVANSLTFIVGHSGDSISSGGSGSSSGSSSSSGGAVTSTLVFVTSE